MNFIPLVGFYYRRHAQISALLSGGAGHSGLVLEFVKANVPVVKKHWPKLNENGLLDDAIATLEAMLTDSPDRNSPYPDNTQR